MQSPNKMLLLQSQDAEHVEYDLKHKLLDLPVLQSDLDPVLGRAEGARQPEVDHALLRWLHHSGRRKPQTTNPT